MHGGLVGWLRGLGKKNAQCTQEREETRKRRSIKETHVKKEPFKKPNIEAFMIKTHGHSPATRLDGYWRVKENTLQS